MVCRLSVRKYRIYGILQSLLLVVLFPSFLSHELLVFFWIVPDGKNEDRSEYPVGWSHMADDNQYIKECNMVFGV